MKAHELTEALVQCIFSQEAEREEGDLKDEHKDDTITKQNMLKIFYVNINSSSRPTLCCSEEACVSQ